MTVLSILSLHIKRYKFNFQSISITPMKGEYLHQSEYVMVRNEVHDVSLNQKESTSPNEKQPPVKILKKHHAVDYIFHDWPSSPSVFTYKIIFCKHTEEMYCDKWWISWQASLFFQIFMFVCLLHLVISMFWLISRLSLRTCEGIYVTFIGFREWFRDRRWCCMWLNFEWR